MGETDIRCKWCGKPIVPDGRTGWIHVHSSVWRCDTKMAAPSQPDWRSLADSWPDPEQHPDIYVGRWLGSQWHSYLARVASLHQIVTFSGVTINLHYTDTGFSWSPIDAPPPAPPVADQAEAKNDG